MEAAIGSLLPYYGAKRTMAPEIVRELGPHKVYFEPFCGSLAVLLAKPPCRMEVANDLHGDVVNLARCVQSPTLGPKLYRRLRRVLACQESFKDALAVVRTEEPPPSGSALVDIDRAYAYFIASWQGMNGVAGTATTNTCYARRFTSGGGDHPKRWSGAVRSIPAWRRRMEGVHILGTDGIDMCEKIEDKDGTVILADPPYLAKGAKYKHDFTEADHDRLAKALGRFRKTRVVVCYYDHPRLAGLYPGWNVRRIDVAKSMVNSGRRDETGATKAPEVLLVNGPLAADVTGGFSLSEAR